MTEPAGQVVKATLQWHLYCLSLIKPGWQKPVEKTKGKRRVWNLEDFTKGFLQSKHLRPGHLSILEKDSPSEIRLSRTWGNRANYLGLSILDVLDAVRTCKAAINAEQRPPLKTMYSSIPKGPLQHKLRSLGESWGCLQPYWHQLGVQLRKWDKSGLKRSRQLTSSIKWRFWPSSRTCQERWPLQWSVTKCRVQLHKRTQHRFPKCFTNDWGSHQCGETFISQPAAKGIRLVCGKFCICELPKCEEEAIQWYDMQKC